MLSSLIDRSADFIIGEVAQDTSWREWKQKAGFSKKKNDFLDIYVEAIIAFAQEEKPRFLMDFFRQESVIHAIEMGWYEKDTDLPFYGHIVDLVNHFAIQQQLGHLSTGEKEVGEFEAFFRRFVRASASVADQEVYRQVKKIDEKLSNSSQGYTEFPHALTPPPFFAQNFLGREAELKALHQHLFSDQSIVLLVNGIGGVGKTSLAARYYQDHQGEYAHVAWVLSEKSIAKALLQLAPSLQLEFDQQSQEQRLQLLLTKLANLESPSLLVIDNANEAEDLKANFQNLNRFRNLHILLTTRITEFQDLQPFPVKGLPETEALKLFQQHYKGYQQEEEALLKDIIKAVENNTLIIEILAKNLQKLNQLEPEYHLKELLEDIQQSLLKLSKTENILTPYQAKGSGLRDETPEAIILAMYDISDLSAAEKNMISIFAALPNERIDYTLLKTLLPDAEIKAPLLSLAQQGWIEYNDEDCSFKVNQVVQDVVREKHQDRLLEDCQLLISTLIDQLMDQEIHHKDNELFGMTLVHYAEALVSTLPHLNYHLLVLCNYIGNYHLTTGDLIKALEIYEKYEQVAQALLTTHPEDPNLKNGLAISYSKLGSTHSSLGNLEKALKYFEKDLGLTKELYESYPQNVSFKNGLAISYSKLGETHSSLGNLEKALKYFEDETELFAELYESYPQNVSFKNGLAISYSKLGETHSSLGNLEKALKYFEDRSRLGEELYESYPQNVSFKNGLAISYAKLGVFYSEKLKDPAKAKGYFQSSIELWEALSSAYPSYIEFSRNYENAKKWLADLC